MLERLQVLQNLLNALTSIKIRNCTQQDFARYITVRHNAGLLFMYL
jgi:hypothetical protein